MLLSAVSFLVVAQSSSEVPEGLLNNPVLRLQSSEHNTMLSGLPVTKCVCGLHIKAQNYLLCEWVKQTGDPCWYCVH